MINQKYQLWCEKAVKDSDLQNELKNMEGNESLISDAFYKDLEFGTGGLRGIIGAGTNRMNIYTVGKASQGLAAYVNSVTDNGSIAVAYDSRIKSETFAKESASIFAANGIKVYIYKELMPTPMLSYAVRRLKCDAGIVVTASHNPSKYNGYKAYGPDGSQLNLDAADYVLSIMNKVDIFSDISSMDFDLALKQGKIEYIGDDIIDEYLDNVQAQRVSPETDLSSLKVIYTPLNGAGNKPVRAILNRIGVKDVYIVKEQEQPDGNFPTIPYPNPEIRQTFECGLKMAETINPDILIATDPDSDRVGTAIKENDGYRLLTGNEMGVLLLNYIINRRREAGTLPENPIAVKTIVSTELCARIAKENGCEIIDVLTGFKFIGEQITILEDKEEQNRFIFGYEESYGYLTGNYARDKDAVVATMLICEMIAFYKKSGKTLIQVLNEIYEKYGFYYNTQKSFVAEGQSGMEKIKSTIENLRENPPSEISGNKIIKINDYQLSISKNIINNTETVLTLPQSNVLCFYLEDGGSVIVRPSGTEPKIKLYICSVGKTSDEANKKMDSLVKDATNLLAF